MRCCDPEFGHLKMWIMLLQIYNRTNLRTFEISSGSVLCLQVHNKFIRNYLNVSKTSGTETGVTPWCMRLLATVKEGERAVTIASTLNRLPASWGPDI
jgi:hypothetical protein